MKSINIKAMKYATYYYGAKFGDFPGFYGKLGENGSFNHIEDWYLPLLTAERNKLIKNSETKLIQNINKEFLPEVAFLKQYRNIIETFSSLLSCEITPEFFLVDNLPEPFSSKDWDSMFIDEEDEAKFFIKKGIYYRKDALTHCYFEFVISHEIAHWIISHYSKKYFPYVSLLEEGLCDFLSMLVLYKNNILPVDVIKNLYIYNRSLKDSNSLWYGYWKFSKMIISFVSVNGLNRLFEIVKSGRENIDKINRNSIIHKGSRKDDIKDIINIFLEADSILLITAAEYHLLSLIIKHKKDFILTNKLNEISELSTVKLKAILSDLEKKGLIAIENSNSIFSIFNQLPNNIKYSIP